MNTYLNGWRLLFTGRRGWQPIAAHPQGVIAVLFKHTVPFALIPALCWYVGVTQYGWQVAGDPVRLTQQSALPLCTLFFFACVFGVIFLGYMVHWMSSTYGDTASIAQSTELISYTATPFFVAGFIGLYPILWLDMLIGVAVACYCIYLLYTGVAPVMKVREEKGFLYASAVFAVALVSFVGLLTVTVLLWDFGPAPEYTY